MDLVCIIPARGGSKGVPGKNLRQVDGQTLVARATKVAIESNVFKRIHISTDSEEIQAEALRCGGSCEFLRPAEISGDSLGTGSAILHSLEEFKRIGERFDGVIELQPTYVFRRVETVRLVADSLKRHETAVTIKRIEGTEHPDFACTRSVDGKIRYGRKRPDQFARQETRDFYAVLGIALGASYNHYMNQNTFFSEGSKGIIINNGIELFDINSELDLEIAEIISSRNYGEAHGFKNPPLA